MASYAVGVFSLILLLYLLVNSKLVYRSILLNFLFGTQWIYIESSYESYICGLESYCDRILISPINCTRNQYGHIITLFIHIYFSFTTRSLKNTYNLTKLFLLNEV